MGIFLTLKNYVACIVLPVLRFRRIRPYLSQGYYELLPKEFRKTEKRTRFTKKHNNSGDMSFPNAVFGSFGKCILQNESTIAFVFFSMTKSEFVDLLAKLKTTHYEFAPLIACSVDKRMIVVKRITGYPCYDNHWRIAVANYFLRVQKKFFKRNTRQNNKSYFARHIGIRDYEVFLQHGDLHCENILKTGFDSFVLIDYDSIGECPLFYDFFMILLAPRSRGDDLASSKQHLNLLVQNISWIADGLPNSSCTDYSEMLDKYLALFFLFRFEWLCRTIRVSKQTAKMEMNFRVTPFDGLDVLGNLPKTKVTINYLVSAFSGRKFFRKSCFPRLL